MFPKNILTKIQNKSILYSDVKCSELGNFTRLYVHKAAMLCAISSYRSPTGGFLCSQNNQNQYVQLSTTRKKTSSEKLAKSELKKTIKQIISNILDVVKGVFKVINFKPKSPVFSE